MKLDTLMQRFTDLLVASGKMSCGPRGGKRRISWSKANPSDVEVREFKSLSEHFGGIGKAYLYDKESGATGAPFKYFQFKITKNDDLVRFLTAMIPYLPNQSWEDRCEAMIVICSWKSRREALAKVIRRKP